MAIARNEWQDVDEKKRTYFFPKGKLVVLNVKRFLVSETGRHYLQKANGKYFVMQKGWLGVKVDGDLVAR